MQFTVSTKIDPRVDEESTKTIKKVYKISMIVGLIGIVAYLLIACIAYVDTEDPWWLDVELYTSSILFAIGLIFPLAMKSMAKKTQKTTENVVNVYEFFDEYVLTTSYRGEDKIVEAKNYYTEITKIKKTEHYVLLYLGLRGAYPIEISALTEEQCSFVLHIKEKQSPKSDTSETD